MLRVAKGGKGVKDEKVVILNAVKNLYLVSQL